MGERKVILITGSSKGIGALLIKNFALKGFKVVLNYSKSEKEASALFNEISAFSNGILKIKADVSDREQVKLMFDQVIEKFDKVDALINNAGLNIDDSFLNMTDEKWKRVIDTNLTGTFICSQEFAFHFKGENGHIINIGASTGIRGRRNGVNYCSAKAGVITLTKCLALELAPKIRVNCIIPGLINTEEVMTRYDLYDKNNFESTVNLIPLQRIGTSEDIFKVAYYIVNEDTYINGQNIFVNGGDYMG
ncbi:MAG: SDR family NAD(P)-dependent oxidoreductase [Actinomycetota bacterium]|nr:SDR family NAD(P)-dependent oxidoreductase [Actinomycetota bacterium]